MSARFSFSSNRAGSTFQCRLDDNAFELCASPREISNLLAGARRFEVRAIDPAGNVDASPARHDWRIQFEAPAPGPEDAAAVAPETKASAAQLGEITLVGESTEFLYTGADPIQKQVAPDAIEPERASVLRGRVTRRDGSAIGGVRVTVLDHPELGRTATRDDGGFELAVNGGGSVVVEFEREGYVPSQRQLEVSAQDFERVEEIVLVPFDDQVSGVDLAGAGGDLQVAQSAAVTDGDGMRRATLLLEPGTDATATMPDGSIRALGDRLNIRATEFTIGASGPAAMPGELPPTSAYTYAVEYSVDEASGAVDVRFDKPVVTYVDNYLEFPAGTPVPMGYYDRDKGQWIAGADGVVIDIVGEVAGRAQIDADGDGAADTASQLAALGVDDAELEKLADLYAPGKSLWRAPISHFTPWDYNWPYGLPDGADDPDQPGPDGGDPDGDDRCGASGSIILCESQTLGERAPVAGTPYSLSYTSERVPGRRTSDSLEIPLTGAAPPATLSRVDLEIDVAGRTISKSFARAPNLSETFIFDGKDAYGRQLQGRQRVDVHIDYVYGAVYREPAAFQASFASIGTARLGGNRARQEISVGQDWSGFVGGLSAPPSSIAGWNIDVHHAYDPVGRTLYLGDGTQRSAEGQNFDVISTVTTALSFPEGLAVAPDGSLLVADSSAHVVRRIAPSGATTVVAGTGAPGFGGDGAAATAALLNHPSDVALAPDGSFFIADESNNRIRKVATDGKISTIAGTGAGGYAGDGAPALAGELDEPSDVATDADGAVYIVDRANHAIRRVGPEGNISTVAGNGSPGFAGDGGVASQARLRSPRDVAVRADGVIFVADGGNHRVRKIGPDGTIQTLAGDGSDGYRGDGGQATDASLDTPSAVLPLPDGGFLVADAGNAVLRKVASEGTIATVGGNGTPGFRGDGGPAAQARLDFPQAIVAGPDDAIYLADAGNDRIRKLAPSLPGLQLGEFTIASEDAQAVYVFDRSGRHLRTVDALTKANVLRFSYDQQGRLTGIEDGDGLDTTIQRSAGTPTAIVGPYGQTTSLQLSAGGYLSRIENPAGERILLEYGATGLMSKLTDPRDGIHTFEYDPLGRLTKDTAPGNAAQTLVRTVSGSAVTVRRTTAEGRVTSYRVERTPAGDVRKTVTRPDGRSTVTVTGNDGSTSVTQPDGTRAAVEIGPDPRFGMQAPLAAGRTLTLPSGLRATVETRREVTLENPSDLLTVRRLTDTLTVNGRVSTHVFDGVQRRFVDTASSGRTLATDVDDQRRPVREEVAEIAPTSYEYDADGRLTRQTQGARSTRYTYDARGRTASVVDALGRATEFAYDTADRLTRETLPDGRVIAYVYDANGNVSSLTTPGGREHTFSHTARDLVERYSPPPLTGGPTPTTYAYDKDRNPTVVTRPDGEAVGFTYDAAGRLERFTHARGSTQLSYDPTSGKPRSATAPGDERIEYGFDGALPVRWTFAGTSPGEVSHMYDDELRLLEESVNGAGAVSYVYDADGLITSAGVLSVTPDAQTGLVGAMSLASNSTEIARNQFGEPETMTAQQSGAPLISENFVRDVLGRITTRVETRGAVTRTYAYSYDAADRLRQVTREGVTQATYSYDVSGNRVEVVRGSGPPITAAYDAQNRLTRHGTTDYEYTPAGELRLSRETQSGDVTTYEYDAIGALTGVTLPSGAEIEYVIDAAGRRIARKRNGQLTQRFVYGPGLGPLAELNAAGGVESRFVYATGSNAPEYIVRGLERYRLITDHLGSPRIVVNADTGAVAQEMDYDEFGRVTRDTNPGFQPFAFAGGLYDTETRLVRFGARDYDPETGRFTVSDPIGFEGGDTNLYSYVQQDPVNVTDASGMCPPCIAFGIRALAGAAIELGTQAIGNKLRGCGAFDDIDWVSVGLAAVTRRGRGRGAAPRSGIAQKGAKGSPKPSPRFKPPTNAPQAPPTTVPPGWRVREMPPTQQYPNGYWRMEKPMDNGGWQGINPSTMRPGAQHETHVPLPDPGPGGP